MKNQHLPQILVAVRMPFSELMKPPLIIDTGYCIITSHVIPFFMIMDILEILRSSLVGDKRTLATYVVYADGLFAFCLFICSFVVVSTANAGFDVLLTAFLNAGFVAGVYYVMNYSKSPIAVRVTRPLCLFTLRTTNLIFALPIFRWVS